MLRLTRRHFLAHLGLGTLTLATGCGGGSGGSGPVLPGGVDPVETGLGEIGQSGWTLQRSVQIQPKKKWTVLVFMNGANDLEQYGVLNMNQLEKVGSTVDVNIVVEFKRYAGRFDSSNGDWGDTRRYYIRRDSDDSTINSLLLSQNNSVDMGDKNRLQDFINWGVRTFPAERYNLVIWNHGAGWRSVKLTSKGRGVSYDDVTGNHINTIDIPSAIQHPDGKKWDLLSVDCSLMQMIEVVYEWRNTANLIVGSEESPPAEGYPYDAILGRLIANPTMETRELATHYAEDTATRFANQYGITQSVVDTSKVAAIVPALDALGATLLDLATTRGADISLAREDSQAYEYPENKDLIHFLDRLDFRLTNATLQAKTAAVRSAVNAALVANAATKQYSPNSRGLAAFLPTPNRYRIIDIEQANGFGQRYSTLALASAAPQWQSFLANGPR